MKPHLKPTNNPFQPTYIREQSITIYLSVRGHRHGTHPGHNGSGPGMAELPPGAPLFVLSHRSSETQFPGWLTGRNAGLLGGAVSFRVLGNGVRGPGRFASVDHGAPCAAAHGVGTSPRVPAVFSGHGWGVIAQLILTTRTSPSHSFSPAPHPPHLRRKRETSFFFFLIN